MVERASRSFRCTSPITKSAEAIMDEGTPCLPSFGIAVHDGTYLLEVLHAVFVNSCYRGYPVSMATLLLLFSACVGCHPRLCCPDRINALLNRLSREEASCNLEGQKILNMNEKLPRCRRARRMGRCCLCTDADGMRYECRLGRKGGDQPINTTSIRRHSAELQVQAMIRKPSTLLRLYSQSFHDSRLQVYHVKPFCMPERSQCPGLVL